MVHSTTSSVMALRSLIVFRRSAQALKDTAHASVATHRSKRQIGDDAILEKYGAAQRMRPRPFGRIKTPIETNGTVMARRMNGSNEQVVKTVERYAVGRIDAIRETIRRTERRPEADFEDMAAAAIVIPIGLQRAVRCGDKLYAAGIGQDSLVTAGRGRRLEAQGFGFADRDDPAKANAPIAKGKTADINVAAVDRRKWRGMIQTRLRNCDIHAGDGDAPGIREDRLLTEKQQQ